MLLLRVLSPPPPSASPFSPRHPPTHLSFPSPALPSSTPRHTRATVMAASQPCLVSGWRTVSPDVQAHHVPRISAPSAPPSLFFPCSAFAWDDFIPSNQLVTLPSWRQLCQRPLRTVSLSRAYSPYPFGPSDYCTCHGERATITTWPLPTARSIVSTHTTRRAACLANTRPCLPLT